MLVNLLAMKIKQHIAPGETRRLVALMIIEQLFKCMCKRHNAATCNSKITCSADMDWYLLSISSVKNDPA